MLMLTRHIMLILSFTFSIQACAAENQAHRDSQFIVQLTDNTIQKFQNKTSQVQAHRNTKLQQWSKLTGLILTAVPPTNPQRWIIKANTQDAAHIKNLISTVNNDADIKYIERDGIMTIQPIQRPIPMQPPMSH